MRVGVIGKGFGERVVAKAIRAIDGCEVVDVVSPRDEAAVSALCQRDDVDLVSVHSPPFMHVQHVQQAVAAGHAVLCDKPFGRSADEARTMCALAENAGVLGFVNFEIRYDITRLRVRELIAEGAIGEPEHVNQQMLMALSRVPLANHGWQFDAALGGGWLGALGSHLIDFNRWTFGEIVEATGQLRTAVLERPDTEGGLRRCSAEDGFTATLRTDRGVSIVINSSSAAPVNLPSSVLVVGSAGVLEVNAESRITIHDAEGSRDVFVDEDPRTGTRRAQQRWMEVVRDALRTGNVPADAPTFTDGLACAEVMDRLRG